MTAEKDFETFISHGLNITEECLRMANMIESFDQPLNSKMRECLVRFLRLQAKYTELTMTTIEKMRV